jgi:hypothetical protein
VNATYSFVDTERLVQQFLQVVDTNNTLLIHIIYTLCFCISIGCQAQGVAADELAVVWYENGRRYLDNNGWDMNLNVMRALALIGMFHINERPATAHRYLGTVQNRVMGLADTRIPTNKYRCGAPDWYRKQTSNRWTRWFKQRWHLQ